MGQTKSQFTEEELQDYEDLTFFSKKEILWWVLTYLTIFANEINKNTFVKLHQKRKRPQKVQAPCAREGKWHRFISKVPTKNFFQ